MAIGVLVLGESGTGKTYSMKNFKPEELKIISVSKPILPFRGKYEIVKAPTGEDIIREMKNTDKKVIVIDDFQYVLGVQMMKRIGELGWQKFNEIEQPYSDVLDAINDLPDDTIVYLTSHVMYNDDTGKTQIKTVGKALDKYITIEGLFMIVLGTKVVDGKYYFRTQNDGANTLKSPEGMFPSLLIPNDLKYVDDHIRNYYYMDGAKSDEEMAREDEEHKVDETAVEKKKTGHRRGRTKSDEAPAKADRDFYAKTPAGTVFTVFKGENLPQKEYTEITKEEYDAALRPETQTTEVETPEEVPFEEAMNVPETRATEEELKELVQTEAPKKRRRRVRKEA